MTDQHYAAWKYAEDLIEETPELEHARRASLEMGIEPITPATGAALAQLVAAMHAGTVIEIGTGLGVSGLWLLRGAPAARLTSIDVEPEHQATARELLLRAGVPTASIRLIAGRAAEVLPRINDASYDLVLIDADPASLTAYLEEALRIVRAGGTVAIPRVLRAGRVADPTARDDTTQDLRDLLRSSVSSPDVVSSVLPVGDGLLLLTKR